MASSLSLFNSFSSTVYQLRTIHFSLFFLIYEFIVAAINLPSTIDSQGRSTVTPNSLSRPFRLLFVTDHNIREIPTFHFNKLFVFFATSKGSWTD